MFFQSFVIFLFSMCLLVTVIFKHYYGLLNIEKAENGYEEQTMSVLEIDDVPLSSENSDKIAISPGTKGTEKIIRILLIGVDSRDDDFKGRSDSMIMFDINPETKKILMTSFLRDIYIAIPGRSNDRLNAAYAFGGANLLTKTIYGSFGIDVNKYITINFEILKDIIDAFGGVNIEVTKEEIEYINQSMSSKERISSERTGKKCLNGKQALAYARIRYLDSDFGRTERQRNIVAAVFEKLKKMKLLEIDTMLKQFLPRVTTNLTEKDILSLLTKAINLKEYSMESMAIPVEGTWEYVTIDEKAVIKIDFAENAKAWYNKIIGE